MNPEKLELTPEVEGAETPAESLESPESRLGRELAEVLQTDEPEPLLVQKILERKIEPEAYQPLLGLVERLEGVFALGERAHIVEESVKEGLPQNVAAGLLNALLKDERRTIELLKRFASHEYKKAQALHGEEIPHEALAEARERILGGVVSEVERLKRPYITQGKEVPEKKAMELQEFFKSLAKPFRDYIRNELGSIVLSQVAAEGPQKEKLLEDIYGTLRLIDGEEQEKLARDAYGLYEKLGRYFGERGIEIFKRLTPSGRPPFHISGMEEILKRAWEYEEANPALVRQDRQFLQALSGLQEFLAKKGHRGIKEAVYKRIKESRENVLIREERRSIFDINREVAELMVGDEPKIQAELKEYADTLKRRLKEDLSRLVAGSPVYEFAAVSRIISAIPAVEEVQKEVDDLEKGVRRPFLERIYIPPEAENRYTADAFQKLVSERMVDFESKTPQAEDNAQRTELARKIAVAKILQESEDTVDYSLRLRLAFSEGVISAEEHQGFLTFVEVNAMIVEAKARMYEAEVDFLKRQDPSRMSEKDRAEREERILEYSSKARSNSEFAAFIRQGAKEARAMLKK